MTIPLSINMNANHDIHIYSLVLGLIDNGVRWVGLSMVYVLLNMVCVGLNMCLVE